MLARSSLLLKFRSATSFQPIPAGEMMFPLASLVYQSGCSVIHGLSHEVWLAIQSRITFMSMECAFFTSDLRSSIVPYDGFTALKSLMQYGEPTDVLSEPIGWIGMSQITLTPRSWMSPRRSSIALRDLLEANTLGFASYTTIVLPTTVGVCGVSGVSGVTGP